MHTPSDDPQASFPAVADASPAARNPACLLVVVLLFVVVLFSVSFVFHKRFGFSPQPPSAVARTKEDLHMLCCWEELDSPGDVEECVSPKPSPFGSPGHGRVFKELLWTLSNLRREYEDGLRKRKERGLQAAWEWDISVDVQREGNDIGEHFWSAREYLYVYQGLRNIIVELKPVMTKKSEPVDARDLRTGTVMVSAHYDTGVSAAGCMDDKLGLASMLHTFRVLLNSPPEDFRHPIILFFNDGEEVGLLGSTELARQRYGYYDSSSKLDDPIVFLNLESAGIVGKPLILRATSSWVLREFSTIYPDTVVSNFIFPDFQRSGLTGSDTDYSAFVSYSRSRMFGVDTAFYEESMVYHTDRDRFRIVADSSVRIQQEMSVDFVRHFGMLEVDFEVEEDEEGLKNPLFFDYMGRLLVVDTRVMRAAIVILLLGALITLGVDTPRSFRKYGRVIVGTLCLLLHLVVTMAMAIGVAYLIHRTVPLFYFSWPAIFGVLAVLFIAIACWFFATLLLPTHYIDWNSLVLFFALLSSIGLRVELGICLFFSFVLFSLIAIVARAPRQLLFILVLFYPLALSQDLVALSVLMGCFVAVVAIGSFVRSFDHNLWSSLAVLFPPTYMLLRTIAQAWSGLYPLTGRLTKFPSEMLPIGIVTLLLWPALAFVFGLLRSGVSFPGALISRVLKWLMLVVVVFLVMVVGLYVFQRPFSDAVPKRIYIQQVHDGNTKQTKLLLATTDLLGVNGGLLDDDVDVTSGFTQVDNDPIDGYQYVFSQIRGVCPKIYTKPIEGGTHLPDIDIIVEATIMEDSEETITSRFSVTVEGQGMFKILPRILGNVTDWSVSPTVACPPGDVGCWFIWSWGADYPKRATFSFAVPTEEVDRTTLRIASYWINDEYRGAEMNKWIEECPSEVAVVATVVRVDSYDLNSL